MSERLDLEVDRTDSETVLTVRGEVNMSSSPELRRALQRVLQERPRRLIVDLAGVTYIDSSGMATLVEALQHTRKMEAEMVLRGMRERIRAVFRLARLDEVFTIVE